ncbi:MAG: hypothetical protein N4A63_05980 [Vallitalea sp.]|jgi:hypothetical protein|nr:hypothetical protein [Vallitalea sp.]
MITFSNKKRIYRYPNSSIIHLPIDESISSIYSPFSNNYQIIENSNTNTYFPKRKINR